MNYKKFHRSPIYTAYGLDEYYIRDDTARLGALKKSWEGFKLKHPYYAELLEILFEDEAIDVHVFAKPFSETRALLAIKQFEKTMPPRKKINPV